MYEAGDKDLIINTANEKISANTGYIKKVEVQIMELITSNESMQLNYRIITSIKGIGPVNAWMTIAYTENFSSFPDGRHYAVYVGVIPFEHTSGTSKKGRRRTSNLAQKELKQELNQAAKSAITHDLELRAYAERKLKNKEYGLVLNNVKFKLILRMFSLVKRGEKYVENYRKAA
jgi:transposase